MTPRATHLGRWIASLRRHPPPRQVLDRMRDHLLDTIGAAVIGEGSSPVTIVEQVHRAPGEVPVLIDASARALGHAVRVNAVAAHAAEIDDTEGCDHSGAVVVPPILGLLANRADRTGTEVLTAMVAGYEVGRRVQNALGGYEEHNGAGWHSTATCGVFAAAAASASLLRLDETACGAALGIAASASAGGWAFAEEGAVTKQLHAANAAGNGLEAALLAEAGARGPVGIFDAIWGSFFTTHGTGAAEPDLLLKDLGATWHAEHSAIKMYAACRSAHPPIDALVDALDAGTLDPETVQSVRIEVPPFLRPMICPHPVLTSETARMSLPVSIALLLGGRSLRPDDYLDHATPSVRRRLATMSVHEIPRLTQPRLLVETPERILTLEREHARGSSPHPFSSTEVRTKFRSLTQDRLDDRTVDAVIAWVYALDDRVATPPPPMHAALARTFS